MKKMFQTILKDLLSRKFLAFLLVMYYSHDGMMLDKVSGGTWQAIALAGLGIFAAANVYQKIKAPPPTTPETPQ